jgi:hypothetical protein
MLIEAVMLPRKLTSHLLFEENDKKRKSNTQFYTVYVATFVIPFRSGSGSGTVIDYGSGSDFLAHYGSGSASQKVTVPTVPVQVPVPVPQRCLEVSTPQGPELHLNESALKRHVLLLEVSATEA